MLCGNAAHHGPFPSIATTGRRPKDTDEVAFCFLKNAHLDGAVYLLERVWCVRVINNRCKWLLLYIFKAPGHPMKAIEAPSDSIPINPLNSREGDCGCSVLKIEIRGKPVPYHAPPFKRVEVVPSSKLFGYEALSAEVREGNARHTASGIRKVLMVRVLFVHKEVLPTFSGSGKIAKKPHFCGPVRPKGAVPFQVLRSEV